MRKKLYVFVAVLLVAAFVLAACGKSTPAPAAKTEAPKKPFRIAVVLPSSINDLAFSQSMYDALVAVQKQMGGKDAMQFVYSDGMYKVDDAAAAIRDYASQGYDLIIAHGSQYGSSLQEIAPDFPNTSFAWGTTVDTFGMPNVFAYEAASEQGGYVNGVMAAKLSKSGVLGVIGPIETGDASRYVQGFIAGAKATNPNIKVNVTWTGSFSDVSAAAEAANTHISAGADVLTGTAQMVVGAIGVAKEKNVLWFGTQADQSSLAPNIVVANQVYHWEVVLTKMIDMIQHGKLGGQAFTINLKNGGEVIEYNPKFNLPPDVKKAAEDAIKGIEDGSIKIELKK